MEENKKEKKQTKIALGTVICLFIIIMMVLAIIYLCVMFADKKVQDAKEIDSLKTELKNSQETNKKLQDTLGELQNKIDDIDDVINSTKTTEPDTTATTEPQNNSEKITDISEIEKILKNKGQFDQLIIKEVEKDNDKYLISAAFYEAKTVNEDEFNKIIADGKTTIDDVEYVVKKSYSTYFLCKDDEDAEHGYAIRKQDDGNYAFIHEIGGVETILKDFKTNYKFYLNKDVSTSTGDGKYGDFEKLYSDAGDYISGSVVFLDRDGNLSVYKENR